MKKILVIAIALTFALSFAAFAGQNHLSKVAVHVKAHPTSCTKAYPVITTCTGIVFTWAPLGDLDAMPIFYDLVAYTVVETGLQWPEAAWGSGSWVKCKGDIAVGVIQHTAVPEVPAETEGATNGTAVAWSTCQYTWGVLPGFVWLAATTPGKICPVPNPRTGDYGFVDCTPTPGPYYDRPFCISCAGIGGLIGDDPCRPTATDESTWGQIKSMFK